jgi:hypothetical protein
MNPILAAMLGGSFSAFLFVSALPATSFLDKLTAGMTRKLKDVLSYNNKSLELVSRRSKVQHKRLKAQRDGIDSLISKLSTLKASQHKNPAFPLELIKEIQSELQALKGLK